VGFEALVKHTQVGPGVSRAHDLHDASPG
jgi:hypothetical protein